ncbi:MAG: DUF1573 domain-containing protein [Planctomycetaceae bacterium]
MSWALRMRFGHICWLALAIVFGAARSGVADELNWAQKMFSQLDHNFGVVASGAEVSQRIQIRNLYKETVTIANVGTSCGCTKAAVSANSIPSGEAIWLTVSIDTENFRGQKDTHVDVRVTFDNVHFKDVRIAIHTYIRKDVVIEPGSADIGTVGIGAGGQRELTIKYAGRDNWAIREIRTGSNLVKAVAEETSRGGGRVNYRMTVTLDPNAPQGPFRDRLTIVTDDASNPFVPVNVTANVEPDIVVATPSVDLGPLSPGVAKTFRVVVRGREPFSIETIECDSARECFRVKLPKDSKTVHVLPITIDPPAEPGPLEEAFSIRINGRDEPVRFQAAGNIN